MACQPGPSSSKKPRTETEKDFFGMTPSPTICRGESSGGESDPGARQKREVVSEVEEETSSDSESEGEKNERGTQKGGNSRNPGKVRGTGLVEVEIKYDRDTKRFVMAEPVCNKMLRQFHYLMKPLGKKISRGRKRGKVPGTSVLCKKISRKRAQRGGKGVGAVPRERKKRPVAEKGDPRVQELRRMLGNSGGFARSLSTVDKTKKRVEWTRPVSEFEEGILRERVVEQDLVKGETQWGRVQPQELVFAGWAGEEKEVTYHSGMITKETVSPQFKIHFDDDHYYNVEVDKILPIRILGAGTKAWHCPDNRVRIREVSVIGHKIFRDEKTGLQHLHYAVQFLGEESTKPIFCSRRQLVLKGKQVEALLKEGKKKGGAPITEVDAGPNKRLTRGLRNSLEKRQMTGLKTNTRGDKTEDDQKKESGAKGDGKEEKEGGLDPEGRARGADEDDTKEEVDKENAATKPEESEEEEDDEEVSEEDDRDEDGSSEEDLAEEEEDGDENDMEEEEKEEEENVGHKGNGKGSKNKE